MIAYPTSADPADWAALWSIIKGDFSNVKLAANALYDLEGYALGKFLGSPAPAMGGEAFDPRAFIQAQAEGRMQAWPNVDWAKLLAFLIQLATTILPYLKPTPAPAG